MFNTEKKNIIFVLNKEFEKKKGKNKINKENKMLRKSKS